MKRLAILLPLALAACADSVSGIYHDTTPDGRIVGARASFIAGYSMAPELNSGSARRMVHERLAAIPEGSLLTLEANGCLIYMDPIAVSVIEDRKIKVMPTDAAGCDGRFLYPTTPQRSNPGGL